MGKLYIQRRFWQTPNELLNKRDVSLKAKWLYWFLQCKPDGWKFSVERIAKQCKDGKDSISTWLKELEKAWYLNRKPTKNHETGRWDWYDYMLYDTPFTENPSTGKPSTENTPTLSKKDNSKKDNSNSKEPWEKTHGSPPWKNSSQKKETVQEKKAKKLIKRFIEKQSRRSQVSAIIKKKGKEKYIEEQYRTREKLLRLGIKERQIQDVLKFIVEDDFRSWNIMSIHKLDKKSTKTDTKYIFMMIDAIKKKKQEINSKDPVVQFIDQINDVIKRERMLKIRKDRKYNNFETTPEKLKQIYSDRYE